MSDAKQRVRELHPSRPGNAGFQVGNRLLQRLVSEVSVEEGDRMVEGVESLGRPVSVDDIATHSLASSSPSPSHPCSKPSSVCGVSCNLQATAIWQRRPLGKSSTFASGLGLIPRSSGSKRSTATGSLLNSLSDTSFGEIQSGTLETMVNDLAHISGRSLLGSRLVRNESSAVSTPLLLSTDLSILSSAESINVRR